MAKYADRYAELVDGRPTEIEMPSMRHGLACVKATRFLDAFVDGHRLGRVFPNDSLFLIRRNPDVLRGPDVCYYSFARMPGAAPDGVCEVAPELAVEVKSPSNTWTELFVKVGEYLEAGVTAVLLIDPERRTASVYRSDTGQVTFAPSDTLTLPDVLPGFAVEVAKFFE